MSEQIKDLFFWNNEEWVFIEAEDIYKLFDPEKYGLNPTAPATICWKGFVIQFCVKGNELFFDKLWVYCDNGNYPPINGIEASVCVDDLDLGFYVYKNISKRLYYSGVIIIGQKFKAKYTGYTFINAYIYEKVYKLVFENGVLKSFTDISDTYKAI